VKDLLRFLSGFAPWILFAALAGPPALRLKASILACLLLAVVSGYRQLGKGFLLSWGSLLFFGVQAVGVVGLGNVWLERHMGILASGTLAAIALVSLAAGRPFVLQYARESAPPERWNEPAFIRAGWKLTAVWSALFLLSTGLAWYKSHHHLTAWLSLLLGLAPVAFGIAYTEIYKFRARAGRNGTRPGGSRP